MNVIGIGNTAEVMEYGKDKVCKLFFEGYPKSSIEHEYNNAKRMHDFFLPVPSVYGLEKLGNRYGIIYDRLYGNSLLDQLFQDGDVEFLLHHMATLHKKIISHQTCSGMYYKEFLLHCIGDNEAEYNEIHNKILQLPEGDYLCHGDYHPGNVWLAQNGDVLVIDFMNACYGPWQYDVARTYFLISSGEVPNDTPNKDQIDCMKKELANQYLKKMEVNYEDISEFLSVIEICRKYEI